MHARFSNNLVIDWLLDFLAPPTLLGPRAATHSYYTFVAALFLIGGALGCGETVCLTLPNPVVQADIRDSITKAPAAYQASLIIAGDGVYDSTFVGARPDSLSVSFIQSAPPGRTGEYMVRVRRIGYRLWQQSGVHVEGSGCAGALSVMLSVRLQPLP